MKNEAAPKAVRFTLMGHEWHQDMSAFVADWLRCTWGRDTLTARILVAR